MFSLLVIWELEMEYRDDCLFVWYIWNGNGLLCVLLWFILAGEYLEGDLITDISAYAGTMSVNDGCNIELSLSFSLLLLSYFCSYLVYFMRSRVLMDNFFFSFRNSLTSEVKLTVYLFNLIIMVLRIVSSIFLSLLLFTTWSIRWSLFSIAGLTFEE